MSETVVSSRAKWILQELIPLVIVLGVGLLGVLLGITEVFTFEGSMIVSIAGFGLFVFLVFENAKRKNRSTLFARLGNDEEKSISVWMKKPTKDKWQGKLDKDANEGKLANLKGVTMISIMGTRVASFSINGTKRLYVPVRLIEDNDDVRIYIAEAVAAVGGKLKFDNKEQAEEFKAIISGEEFAVAKEEREISQPTEEWKRGKKRSTEPANYKKAEEAPKPIVESEFKGEETPAAPRNVQATRAVGYDKYRKKTDAEKINDAVVGIDILEAKKEAERAKKEEALRTTPDDLLLGGQRGSVSIDLPPAQKDQL